MALQTVATGLSSPLFLTAPSADARLFIVERPGRIRIVQDGALLPIAFLDIRNRTTVDGERGVLSLAFDPQYASNGFFYVYFTDLDGNIAIERFSTSVLNPNVADPLSSLRIMSIPHPDFSNHNGGLLAFGPDGDLYIGTGDGGSAGDPHGNAQNTNSLLGKLLRIDVSASTAVQPYAVPASNPFINQNGKRPEIWAYGLRNPWRYAFDAATNLLYIADVGQERREEVDVASANAGGLNYGWNIMEGTLCYPSGACNQQGLRLPVLEYAHDDTVSNSVCSIIGGYVYRGSAIPELRGSYLYSDLCAGWLKSFAYLNGAATHQMDWGNQGVGLILSFGEDAQQELYLLSDNGSVYRIVRK
ncbi:PQQ-dependent sugar dehydrogenase [Undibacterium arcticum]|uniref:PQQ-dependent sugar dehydrogenase n=1 Tax=Undibacterium arcticum TaxID=1762892 RepID=A0ABV7F675_9BURK